MKRFQTSLLILALVASSSAMARDTVKWQHVHDDGEFALSIDPKSIEKEDDQMVTVTVKVVNEGLKNSEMQIDHLLIRTRFDCKVEGRFQFLATMVVSSGENGNYDEPTSSRWETYGPERSEAIVGKTVCAIAERRRR